MFVLSVARTAFITCVPLFLMLTGYLMNNKELNLRYYKGIKKTYSIYIIICIFCLVFRILYQHEELKLREMVLSIFDFSANSYSWYIEMYIGLFLMIPFLNVLWNHMTFQKQRWLIITLLCMTAVPSLTNCWNLFFIESDAKVYNALIPDWWQGSVYIYLYYFLGAYFQKIEIKKTYIKDILLLIGMMIIFGGFTYFRSYNDLYEWTAYNSYYGFQTVLVAFFLFRILLQVPMERCPKIIKMGIKKVSQLSLGIYLASNISDKIIYPKLIEIIGEPIKRMDFIIVVVIFSFLMALLMSMLADYIYKIMSKTLGKLYERKMKIIKKCLGKKW